CTGTTMPMRKRPRTRLLPRNPSTWIAYAPIRLQTTSSAHAPAVTTKLFAMFWPRAPFSNALAKFSSVDDVGRRHGLLEAKSSAARRLVCSSQMNGYTWSTSTTAIRTRETIWDVRSFRRRDVGCGEPSACLPDGLAGAGADVAVILFS